MLANLLKYYYKQHGKDSIVDYLSKIVSVLKRI